MNCHDISNSAPALRFYANHWAMLELPQRPSSETWTFEQGVEKVAAAGYEGYQAGVDQADIVRSAGLRFCTTGRVNAVSEVKRVLGDAASAAADCLTLHVGWGMESDAEMDRLLHAIMDHAAELNLPTYIETHRATIFQDTWRICEAIKRNPQIEFNGDFSHLYCGNEMVYPGFEKSREFLLPILQRTKFCHGRISNAETIQIDVGDGRENAHAKNFQWMWRTVFAEWKRTAQVGDFFIFAPELGPPSSGYSLTDPRSASLIELSDRWAQSLVLRRLAEEAWALA